MGAELHITRKEYHADNEGPEITTEEWLSYVNSDPELKLDPQSDEYTASWLNESGHVVGWLYWFKGSISTKWRDTTQYRKMLKIAAALNAQLQDDDGRVYFEETES